MVSLSDGLESSSLALLMQGVLTDSAERHGLAAKGFVGLSSRLGFCATDSQEEVTLCCSGGRCVIEPGLASPDLTFCGESDLLPRLQTVPKWLGVPIFVSPAGLDLFLSLVQHPLRLRGLAQGFSSPSRVAKALWDAARILRLLAGTY